MTLGIMAGVLFTPILCKRLLSGVDKLEKRDRRWSEIFMNALFMGMISAFLGMIFGHVTEGLTGWIPVFVMLASAVIMLIVGACVKLLKWGWLTDYALSISMVAITGNVACPLIGRDSFQEVDITGITMNLNELATAVANRLPLVVVVLNNSVLGMR